MMRSKLVKLEKLSRKNRYGKCDWKVTLEIDGAWTDAQYWIKYNKDKLIKELRETCNCTIPKQFA